MPTLFYVARHAETELNVQERLQGRSDSPVTPRGYAQARRLRERLAEVPFAAAYSSPSPRAVTTTLLTLEARQVAAGTDERLVEMAMGDWEGLSIRSVEHHHAELFRMYRAYDEGFRAPGGGESWHETQSRMRLAFSELALRHPDATLLVVSHGAAIRMLLGYCLGPGVPMNELPRSRNCALSIIEWSGDTGRVVLAADDSHLEPV